MLPRIYRSFFWREILIRVFGAKDPKSMSTYCRYVLSVRTSCTTKFSPVGPKAKYSFCKSDASRRQYLSNFLSKPTNVRRATYEGTGSPFRGPRKNLQPQTATPKGEKRCVCWLLLPHFVDESRVISGKKKSKKPL